MEIDIIGLISACSYALDCIEAELVNIKNKHGKRVAYISVRMGQYFDVPEDAYVGFENTFGIKPNIFLYFIQDYEPGFYSWSTKYLLADSTYKSDYPTIAIFNSMLLKEFFDENHYHFTHSFAFDPVLNDGLRKALEQMPAQVDKKKQILVYGRPGTERNAFNLVIAALK